MHIIKRVLYYTGTQTESLEQLFTSSRQTGSKGSRKSLLKDSNSQSITILTEIKNRYLK